MEADKSIKRSGKSQERGHRKRKMEVPADVRGGSPPPWLLSKKRDFTLGGEQVLEIVQALGLSIPPEKTSLLLNHLLIARELNRSVNLVSRSNVEGVLLLSLWESLAPLRNTRLTKGKRVVDLGTGGGFPGIPLAIAAPQLEITLLDSRRAKTIALSRMLRDLGIENAVVVHDRAETFAKHMEKPYEMVTARAVGSLREVAPWASSLLVNCGLLLTWKGPEGMREMKELPTGTWKLVEHMPVLPHRALMALEYHRAENSPS